MTNNYEKLGIQILITEKNNNINTYYNIISLKLF